MMKFPQGTEGFFFEEAYRHRQITTSLHQLFNSWGYLPVETPVFDLFDIYRDLIKGGDSDKIYRLIDRDGDLLMLRSDITLFLARQMGLILSGNDLPARICYSDSILRHQDSEDISRNEFYQSGVELIGMEGFRGDAEILLLLMKTIELLDIPVRIHLGSRAVFNILAGHLPEKELEKLIRMIKLRDFTGAGTLMNESGMENQSDDVLRILSFIGEDSDIKNLKTLAAPLADGRVAAEIDYLESLIKTVTDAGFSDIFRIDMSEIGIHPYYTGIVFQVYMENMDTAVISGGRYDDLLGIFGLDAPSVGFSLLQRKIEPGVRNKDRFNPPEKVKAGAGGIVDSFLKAEELRKDGKVVLL